MNFYGLIITFAILCAVLVAEKSFKKYSTDTNLFWGYAFFTILGGIVGARLYHVLSLYSYYAQNPLYIFAIWNGGLGILGAIVGGVIGGFLYLKTHKQNYSYFLNLTAWVLPLAQAVGRWANFANTELYGLPTMLPWGFFVPLVKRIEKYQNYSTFHPLFFYESILDLVLFVFLSKIQFKSRLASYLVGYGIIRFFLEFLRIENWTIYGLNVAQTIALLMISLGIIFLKKRKI